MKPHIEFHFTHQTQYVGKVKNSEVLPCDTDWNTVKSILASCGYKDVRPIRRMWTKWAWPGGYPMYYVVKDGGVLCPSCANKELPRTLDPKDSQFYVIDTEINYEDPELYCDHCNKRIESAYCEDDRKEHIKLLQSVWEAEQTGSRHLDRCKRALEDWLKEHPCFS